MQEPKDLIVRLLVIRLVGVARYVEFDWYRGIAHGSGHQQFLRHIFIRPPEDALFYMAIFTRSSPDSANTGETQVNAVSGSAIEAHVDRALESSTGSKRQRGELKVGFAKTLPPDAGAHRETRENEAKGTESEWEEDLRIGIAPKFWHSSDRDGRRDPIGKNCRQPKSGRAVAIPAFRPVRSPVFPP